MASTKSYNDVTKLCQEVKELKRMVADHRASQIQINAQVMSHLEMWKLWKNRLNGMYRSWKQFNEKYKEMRVEVNVLNKLLSGKLNHCDCDHRIDCITSEQSNVEQRNQSGDRGNIVKKQEKRRRKRERKRLTKIKEESEKESQTFMEERKPNINPGVEKATQTKEEKKRPIYNPGMKRLIGEVNPSMTEIGPLMSLDGDWTCPFDLSHTESARDHDWNMIYQGNLNYFLMSKFILLPETWKGLQVRVKLFPTDSAKYFVIAVCAENVAHNHSSILPQSLGLQVTVTLVNKELFVSDVHTFVLRYFENKYFRCDSSFLHIPLRNVSPHRVPPMTLKFSPV